ncbi:MAG TPA: hypothetical protein VE223_05050 [Nitrososphaeraceae archaeon]|nr:hypothetical protein [Nitrososphaeraceae archaeon]
MMVIFFLVGFGPFFDSISFNILGRHERRKAASLGIANAYLLWWLKIFHGSSIDGGYHSITILRKVF